jgi:hypothetical protein
MSMRTTLCQLAYSVGLKEFLTLYQLPKSLAVRTFSHRLQFFQMSASTNQPDELPTVLVQTKLTVNGGKERMPHIPRTGIIELDQNWASNRLVSLRQEIQALFRSIYSEFSEPKGSERKDDSLDMDIMVRWSRERGAAQIEDFLLRDADDVRKAMKMMRMRQWVDHLFVVGNLQRDYGEKQVAVSPSSLNSDESDEDAKAEDSVKTEESTPDRYTKQPPADEDNANRDVDSSDSSSTKCKKKKINHTPAISRANVPEESNTGPPVRKHPYPNDPEDSLPWGTSTQVNFNISDAQDSALKTSSEEDDESNDSTTSCDDEYLEEDETPVEEGEGLFGRFITSTGSFSSERGYANEEELDEAMNGASQSGDEGLEAEEGLYASEYLEY